uniref:Uncharacterized protein n=1 Tax=Davidia involucrata TaxID=16924 RepID=A0A5B6ZEX1_DAVIN
MDLWNVKEEVNMELANCFKDFWYCLHKHYQKHFPNSSAHPYEGIGQEAWDACCARFSDPKFQEISRKNSENRKKQKVSHCGGSKSFVRHQHELENANPDESIPVSRIQVWHTTHFSIAKNKWISPLASNIYDEMVTLQWASEDSSPLTDDEICDRVLGNKPGYIQGLGHGKRPAASASSRHGTCQLRMDEANRRVEDASRRAEEAEAMVQSLNTRMQQC